MPLLAHFAAKPFCDVGLAFCAGFWGDRSTSYDVVLSPFLSNDSYGTFTVVVRYGPLRLVSSLSTLAG